MNSEVFVEMDHGLFDTWYTVRGTPEKVKAWGDHLLELYDPMGYMTTRLRGTVLEDGVVEEFWTRRNSCD